MSVVLYVAFAFQAAFGSIAFVVAAPVAFVYFLGFCVLMESMSICFKT